MQFQRLLFPALRWSDETGFDHERDGITSALERGVGGFIIFGGPAQEVHDLTRSLRSGSDAPLLIGADLERGAGQQFRGATPLPPLAAIGALDDLAVTRQAAALTGREALAVGVNWVFAPDADLDIEPLNPIIGTRSFGADPVRVAAHVTAWVEGCKSSGALCCAKHFPGHGRTVRDSHAELPVVDARRDVLDMDITPFRAAILAGVDSIMTAHVAFPALDPSGAPATLSASMLEELLRRQLGFDGLIVTDALIMQGILDAGGGGSAASVAAIAAGCDALLYPQDPVGTLQAIENALGASLPRPRVARALGRIAAAATGAPQGGGLWGRPVDTTWANGAAMRAIHVIRGEIQCSRAFDLLVIDDDLGGPYPPPSREPFVTALNEAGFDPRRVDSIDGRRDAVVAVYADIRAWKGRPGLSGAARASIAQAIDARPDLLVALFAHPRLAADVRASNVVAAWGGEALMQTAAARWLAGETTPPSAA